MSSLRLELNLSHNFLYCLAVTENLSPFQLTLGDVDCEVDANPKESPLKVWCFTYSMPILAGLAFPERNP